MAKDTAKRHIKSNEQRLATFRYVTVGTNALHWILAVLWFEQVWWGSVVVWVFWAAHQVLAYKLLAARGAPELTDQGDLIDCADISDPAQLGVYSYAQDLLWICWAAQVLTCLHGIFWVVYLPVPLVAIYKLWTLLVSPMLTRSHQRGGPGDGQEAPEEDLRTRLQRRREQLRARKGKSQSPSDAR